MSRAWVGLILGLLAASSSWAVQVHDVRLWRAPDHTRIVLDLSGPVDHRLLVLQGPDRIVLDLDDTSLKASLDGLALDKTPVTRIRSGVREGDDLRLVLDMSTSVELRSFVEHYDASIAELRIRSLLPIRQLCDLDTFWGEVETELRSICLAKVGQEASDLEPEPGFIVGLRALNNTLGRLWAERF